MKNSIINQDMVGSLLQGKYLFHCKLGSGTFGTVYKVEHLQLNKYRAIKKLIRNSNFTLENEEFQKEAKRTASLQHPNIITVHDFFWEDIEPYFVMELLKGTLQDELNKRCKLPISESLQHTSTLKTCLNY